jgi:glycosyltransferase involved in cell wall biosynthesis
MRLSVLIVAHNEQERLGLCISEAREYADEIVVVVQQSTDLTLDIAMRDADKVLEHPAMGSCEFSRGDGLAACSGEWVLQLDADERLSAHGKANIRMLMTATENVVFGLRRLTVVNGTTIEDALQLRLIRPGDWDGVHNRMHCSLHPREGVRPVAVSGPPFIEHFKTEGEQHTDNVRYQEYGYLTTEIRPEWEKVPWCIRHK